MTALSNPQPVQSETMSLDVVRDAFRTLPNQAKLNLLSSMSDDAASFLRYHTNFLLRDKQIIPADWEGRYYIALTGRGWGKTKMGAHAVKEHVYAGTKGIAIVAATYKDLEDTMVPAILGEFSKEQQPRYVGGNKAKIVCHNKVEIQCFTSDQEIRGGNFSFVWADELSKWNDSLADKIDATFKVLDFACRKGKAQFLITTTPKNFPIISNWVDRFSKGDSLIHIVSGEMDENDALPASAKKALYDQYAHSRLGQQELYGKLLTDIPGALWKFELLDQAKKPFEYKYLLRTVVVADPAVSNHSTSDETGIIVASLTDTGHVVIQADLSGRYSPQGWATVVNDAYSDYRADRVIAEKNNGGDLVKFTLQTVNPHLPVKLISASKGKITRAEPVVALYEQGKVHHLGHFVELERQMTTYTGDGKQASPDRMDALVYACTELLLEAHYGNRVLTHLPKFG